MELLKKVREGEGGLLVGPTINSEKNAALEELAVLVESLDNAGDFATMGGVKDVCQARVRGSLQPGQEERGGPRPSRRHAG